MLATYIHARHSLPLLAQVNVQPRLLFLLNLGAGQLKISTLHSTRNEPPITLRGFQRCFSEVRYLEGEVSSGLPSLSLSLSHLAGKKLKW
jgi:hypothetical protein